MREFKKHKILIFISCLKVLLVLSIAIEEALRGVLNLKSFETYLAISLIILPLSLLISFHKTSQCIFMLTIPKMISKRGRMFIVAATFVIAFAGPTKNLIKNGEILSDSMTCSQDQLKIAMKELANAIKEPYKMIKDTFAKILPIIERNAEKIKGNLLDMKRHLSYVVQNIRKAFGWLANIANMCNSKEASPYEKCTRAFENSVAACRENLGILATFCDVTYLAKNFCYTFKAIDVFCELIDFMSDSVLQDIERRMKEFMNDVKEMFYVSISIDHKFEFHTNSSKNISDIHEEITREIQDRTRHALKFLDYAKIFLSFYFIFIFLKAIKFHRRYLSSLYYKNIYITRQFHEIDERRAELSMERVMPLTRKERKRYIEMTSIKLVRHEWRHIFNASFFLLFSTMHLCGILIADYSLFWIMTMIRHYGSRSSKPSDGIEESEVEIYSINITGQGIIADFCHDLADVLKPLMKVDNVDFTPCLPQPHFPDFKKYRIIMLLTILSWILLFIEPYALRLKNLIMAYYYPETSRDRTVWLYNEILRKRTSFLKYSRRQAKNKLFGSNDARRREEMTCIQIFRSKISRYWILRKVFGQNENLSCLLCGKEDKNDNLLRCETPACIGIFCFECFNDVKKSCPMCKFSLDRDFGSSNENLAEDFNSSGDDDNDDF